MLHVPELDTGTRHYQENCQEPTEAISNQLCPLQWICVGRAWARKQGRRQNSSHICNRPSISELPLCNRPRCESTNISSRKRHRVPSQKSSVYGGLGHGLSSNPELRTWL